MHHFSVTKRGLETLRTAQQHLIRMRAGLESILKVARMKSGRSHGLLLTIARRVCRGAVPASLWPIVDDELLDEHVGAASSADGHGGAAI
jgi:hypothetical protein